MSKEQSWRSSEWKIETFYDGLLITNLGDPREKIHIKREGGHIIELLITRGKNPIRATRIDAKIPYKDVVGEEGGTLVWPMK
jgi:hypothetical protein